MRGEYGGGAEAEMRWGSRWYCDSLKLAMDNGAEPNESLRCDCAHVIVELRSWCRGVEGWLSQGVAKSLDLEIRAMTRAAAVDVTTLLGPCHGASLRQLHPSTSRYSQNIILQ